MKITKSNMIRFLTVYIMTVFLTACGGGGGIVGTGFQEVVARGEVTAVGKGVTVNGIEFVRSSDPGVSETPIELAFENVSTGSEDSLKVGMIVDVSGSYDPASGKGSYSRIIFSPELRGPLDSGSVDTAAGTFSVLGRTILTGAATIFDGIADLNELASRQNQGLELEVSGYLDAQGRIQSTRVALKTAGFTSGKVQIKGAITDVRNGFFSIGSVNVATASATFVNMNAADLKAGLVVEVRGILSGSTVNSARVELKSSSSGASAGETIRIKGVAAGPLSGNSFVLAGPDGTLTVTTSGAVFLRGKNPADASIVVTGARLEVEGTLQADGSLAARKVEAETGQTVGLAGDLTAVDVATGNMILNNVLVRTDKNTSFRDNRNQPVANLTLSLLSPGDHLQIDGFVDESGKIFASQVQRFESTRVVILEGPVTSVDPAGNSLVILGVTVTTRAGAEMIRGSIRYADFASFAAQVAPASTVVKAKGTIAGNIFTASSLEIEQ
jgi:cytoskeletal protein CcmA (bactofilin family)